MSNFDLGYLKRHPWALGAVVLIGGYAVWRIWGGSGGDVAAASGADPALVQAQAALAAKQLDNQSQIQLAAISGDLQLAALKEQNSGQLAIAKENNSTSLAATNIAAQSAVNEINARVAVTNRQIDAQMAADAGNRAVQWATIEASMETALASIGASRDTTLANTAANVTIASYARDVSLAQTNATVKLAKIQSQASIINSAVGVVGGLAGGGLNILGASAWKG